jgi:hypothetical protein
MHPSNYFPYNISIFTIGNTARNRGKEEIVEAILFLFCPSYIVLSGEEGGGEEWTF